MPGEVRPESRKLRCPECRRAVAAGPLPPLRRGAVEIARWTLVPHPPRRGRRGQARGLICVGCTEVIEGAERPCTEVRQATIFELPALSGAAA